MIEAIRRDVAVVELSYDLERCEYDVRLSVLAPLLACSSTATAICLTCGTVLCAAHSRPFGGVDRCCRACREAWAGSGDVGVFREDAPETFWDEVADARERRAARSSGSS